MTLYVVRHGETEWNANNRILGRTDIPLNETGRKQANEAALKAQDLPVDVILSSPLKRTIETATAIAGIKGLPVTAEPALIECDFGDYEGKDRNEPGYQKKKREFFRRYPGGESFQDMAARVYPLIERIKEEYAGKNVMLVTHGGVGRIVDNYFYDRDNEEFADFFMKNCEVREYEVDKTF